MWTPNYGSTPVVKIFAHSSGINSCCVDLEGNYLTTVGNDTKMKIWDLRNSYKSLYEYYNPNPATNVTISQKGLLAVSYNNVIEIWKDYYQNKQKEPYMKHHFKNNKTKIKSLKFVNFEDFLGCGTNLGFSSIIVPGSGIANFDTFENNPYETKNQKKEKEIKNLLEKIPYNMINIDPYKLNSVNIRSKKVIEKEKIEKEKEKVEEILNKEKKRIKKRIKNKEKHDLILKQFDKNQKIRKKMQAMIELQYDKKQNEKKQIKREVQILKDLADDFDPSLYVKENEEN
jgi:U3 small nucleolar RNA-associated protein 7